MISKEDIVKEANKALNETKVEAPKLILSTGQIDEYVKAGIARVDSNEKVWLNGTRVYENYDFYREPKYNNDIN